MLREPPHVGVPSVMDELADRLVRDAGDIGSAANGFLARAESIDFLGPAATRFRAAITQHHATATNVTDRAVALAQTLRRAAEHARLELAAWERYVESLERPDR